MRDGFYKLQEYEWVHTRHVISTILNVNRAPKTPIVKPTDVIRLSFDKEEKSEVKKYYNEEERKALYKRLGITPKNGKHS